MGTLGLSLLICEVENGCLLEGALLSVAMVGEIATIDMDRDLDIRSRRSLINPQWPGFHGLRASTVHTLPCQMHCSEHSICMDSFNPYGHPVSQKGMFPSLCR